MFMRMPLVLAPLSQPRPFLGAAGPPPPGVCCQKDQAGNTVCSDGMVYPAG